MSEARPQRTPMSDLFVSGELSDGGAVTVDATAAGFSVSAAVQALAA